jgi:MarR family transcriptional regulator, organic hydroperoxide resistance regulator
LSPQAASFGHYLEPEKRKLRAVQQSCLDYSIVQLCRAHRAAAGALLSEIGLHPGQEIILMHLWQKDGQSQRQLADLLHVRAPTVTKMLQRLEQTGILERRQSSSDNRVMQVWLTETGKNLEPKVTAIWAELEQRNVKYLEPEEKIEFQKTLQKILKGLQETSSDLTCPE